MGLYLVLCTAGETPPKFVHHDYDLALAEAKRLHGISGAETYVLEIITKVKTVQVPVMKSETTVTVLRSSDDLPF